MASSRVRLGTIAAFTDATGRTRYRARLRLADGSRPRVAIPEDRGYSRARALDFARGLQERENEQGLLLAKKRGATSATKLEPRDSADAWVERWHASRTTKGLTSVRDSDAHWRVHLRPLLGSTRVQDWARDDLRAVCRALDTKVESNQLTWKSAENIWATLTKMCADAASSKLDALRVRDENIARGVEGPDRGAKKAKQYLYPSEFLRFIGCEDVPVLWRRIVALMIYVYPRPGELRELRWEDVDLEHGTLHIHQATSRVTGRAKETKTGTARRFNIESSLLPLLKAMHEESGGEGKVIDLPCDLARGFRMWLLRAGVKRAELHTATPTRKAITVYDLRATGITWITWLAIRGDEPLRIMQRAGHTGFQTTQGYVREAENLREGFGDVFPSLSPLVAHRVVHNLTNYRENRWPLRGSNPHALSSRGF